MRDLLGPGREKKILGLEVKMGSDSSFSSPIKSEMSQIRNETSFLFPKLEKERSGRG